MQIPEALDAAADEQLGLLTLRQLRLAGASRASVRWAIGPTWRLVLPRVIATFPSELDRQRPLASGRRPGLTMTPRGPALL